MPELPEVETTIQGIKPYLQNQTIQCVLVHQPKLRWPVSTEIDTLTNSKVNRITRRAKYIIFHLDNGYILGHLGMSGSLRIVDNQSPRLKHDHIEFILNQNKSIRYNDPRRFGAWLWVNDLATCELLNQLGPEPLSDAFNADYLWQKSRQRQIPIKNFIMNNTIVVGVGNIYANESLFLSGIHPLMPTKKLTKKQASLLTEQIKQVLQKAIEQGGTTLRDFINPEGMPGYFAQQLFVYGRAGKTCHQCNTVIQSAVIGQRNSFYCPQCQRK